MEISSVKWQKTNIKTLKHIFNTNRKNILYIYIFFLFIYRHQKRR